MNEDLTRIKQSLLAGDRRILAKAITLRESQSPAGRDFADRLMQEILPFTGKAHRVGVSGPPGAGKSSLIGKLAPLLSAPGEKVAILTIDPTSPLSGGSILADQTRMAELASHPDIFIRPSPGGLAKGGLSPHARDCLLLCEAAGFRWILVETIGVGQSELAVADMTDMLILLAPPGGGDEWQGIKRGILELADLLIVTKADGVLREAAQQMKATLDRTIPIFRSRREAWNCRIFLSSLQEEKSFHGIRDAIWAFFSAQASFLKAERIRQGQIWFEWELANALRDILLANPELIRRKEYLKRELAENRIDPGNAARQLARAFLSDPNSPNPDRSR